MGRAESLSWRRRRFKGGSWNGKPWGGVGLSLRKRLVLFLLWLLGFLVFIKHGQKLVEVVSHLLFNWLITKLRFIVVPDDYLRTTSFGIVEAQQVKLRHLVRMVWAHIDSGFSGNPSLRRERHAASSTRA